MIQKLKQTFIIFLCTLLLVTNISLVYIKPLPVKAVVAEAAVGGAVAYEAFMLLLDAIAAGLVAIGGYELYENDERFAQVVDTYLGGISGTWDDTVNKWIPQGTDTHYGHTWVLDPTDPAGHWQETGELVTLGEEELKELEQWGAKGVMTWEEYKEVLHRRAEEYARANHPEWFEDEGGSSGGGDSGGDSGNDNNEHPTHDWKAMLKDYWNSNSDTLAKIGSGLIISVSSFMEKVTNGTTGNETIDSWSSEIPEPTYDGTLQKDSNGNYIVHWSYMNYGTHKSGVSTVSSKPYILLNEDSGIQTIGGYQVSWISTNMEFHGDYYVIGTVSASCPIFYSKDLNGRINYLNNGDDSSCINKVKPSKLTWLDMHDISGRLSSILGTFSSPNGKALKRTALKDYTNTMVDYKNNASDEELADPEAQEKKAKEEAEKSSGQNTVEDPVEEEEPKPQPMPNPEYPTPEKITIEDIDATRDWRLVFPFCIPFDMIDLFKVLSAEPKAPYWEIPLRVESFDFEYIFVIDFEQFDTLAEIFRLCETIAFILGLALVTGKVIKW